MRGSTISCCHGHQQFSTPNSPLPCLQKIEQEGRPRAQQLAEQYAKPMGDNASNADQAADQMVEEKLKPAAQDLSNQMQPAADQFSEEQLKPMAAKVRGKGRTAHNVPV